MTKFSKTILLFSVLLSFAFAQDGNDFTGKTSCTTLPVTISCGANPCQSAIAQKWSADPTYVSLLCSYLTSLPGRQEYSSVYGSLPANNPASFCKNDSPDLGQASISSVCSCYATRKPLTTRCVTKTSSSGNCPPGKTVTKTAAITTTAITTSIVTQGSACPSASVRTQTSISILTRTDCPTLIPPLSPPASSCTTSISITTVTSVVTLVIDPPPPSRITITETKRLRERCTGETTAEVEGTSSSVLEEEEVNTSVTLDAEGSVSTSTGGK
ncbi:hypothetical protein ACMFMG_004166 [Clarireedia jacksonii]